MITRKHKEKIVEDLTSMAQENNMIIMADFRGLSVKEMADLKEQISETGGMMRVARKTLMNIVLKEKGVDLDVRKFTGPIVFIFGKEDNVPKKVWGYSKKFKKLKIEGGVLDNKVLDSKEIEMLAKLPSREELLAKLVGTIQGPISGFVWVLSGTTSSFVRVLNAIREKKE